ncbi:MAG: hypothetical protein OEU54_06105 [Gemmatimonadota bacterium]|nr:hypothetical protein [Gemmatimonadota bacterium]
MRIGRAGILSAALMLTTSAHVGNRNVVFQGEAGSYPLTVVIRPPEVVPGLAEISVRVEGEGVERITVQPTYWTTAPEDGAPRPDIAELVAGTADLYAAELWLMTAGAYRVDVTVEGSAGGGVVSVPVTSIATTVLDLPPGLGWVLVGLTLFLFFGAITIFGAAARESVLDASETPDRRARRRGWVAMAIGGLVVAVTAFGGKSWWDSVDQAARSGLFQPLQVEAGAGTVGGVAVLDLAITDPQWLERGYSPLVPDHGKMMHMFVVRSDMGAFAHVHPVPVDSASFRVAWPDLPPGEYRIYGDVVHETGFAQTVVDTVVVDAEVVTSRRESSGASTAEPDPTGALATIAPDADDSAWAGSAVAEPDTGPAVATLPDGSTLTWVRDGSPVVDEPTTLRFEFVGPDGSPDGLELYMGMLSHAAVTRRDGAVFVHLHPTGTISMGSLGVLEARAEGDTTFRTNFGGPQGDYEFMRPELGGDGGEMPGMAGTDNAGVVEFPFAFPRDGDYTIWVQVKRGGLVQTAAFETTVTD